MLARVAALTSAPACWASTSRRTWPQMSSVHIPEASAVRFVTLRRTPRRRTSPLDGRKKPGAGLVDERQRLAIIGLVRLDRLVGNDNDRSQPIEFRVVKYRPPCALRLALARRRDLPALDLLELRRHDRRRPLEVGADRRATCEGERGENEVQGRQRKPRRASVRRPVGRREARELVAPSPPRSRAGYVRSAQSDSEIPLPAGLPSPDPSWTVL